MTSTKTCEACKFFHPSLNKAKTRGACNQAKKKVVEKVYSCSEFASTKTDVASEKVAFTKTEAAPAKAAFTKSKTPKQNE